MSDGNAPSVDERLVGWKEVAAFFGRSVRAVQRWERELALPVHRVRTIRRGSVYAYRSELQQWLARADPMRLQDADGGQAPAAAHSDTRAGETVDGRAFGVARRSSWFAIAAALVTLVAIGGAWFLRAEPAAGAASVRIDGSRLEALATDGTPAWTYDLGFTGVLFADEGRNRPTILTDLDGDGTRDLIVAVRNGDSVNDIRDSDRLLCFTEDGTLVWSYAMEEIPYSFDGERFDGPTRFLSWTADGEGHIWVAVAHHTWWPTVVVRVDAHGAGQVRYVQSGGVYALKAWHAQDRAVIVAGGIVNEYGLASVAVIDAAAEFSVSPQTPGGGFHCDDCPDGAVAAFDLFPRSDVSRASPQNPYSIVNGLDATGDAIRVSSLEGESVVLYHVLHRDLSIEIEPFTDPYRQVHRRFERMGRLDHPFDECPDRAAMSQVAEWRPDSGWISYPPPAASVTAPVRAGQPR
jgi:hypothetical protein